MRFIELSILQASPHFLMTRTDYRLTLALALSLAIHLLPVLTPLLAGHQEKAEATPALQAVLRTLPPPAPLQEQPPLTMPEERATQKPKPPPPPVRERQPAARASGWQAEINKQLAQQVRRGDYYPAEAISRGLQGDVLVLMILDTEGNVSAARVEQSSGHALLDQAALRNVRSLRSLPSEAPREVLLPVSFRLD
jgi:periplasmic protein TonB